MGHLQDEYLYACDHHQAAEKVQVILNNGSGRCPTLLINIPFPRMNGRQHPQGKASHIKRCATGTSIVHSQKVSRLVADSVGYPLCYVSFGYEVSGYQTF